LAEPYAKHAVRSGEPLFADSDTGRAGAEFAWAAFDVMGWD
jgi:hypothetical protein